MSSHEIWTISPKSHDLNEDTHLACQCFLELETCTLCATPYCVAHETLLACDVCTAPWSSKGKLSNCDSPLFRAGLHRHTSNTEMCSRPFRFDVIGFHSSLFCSISFSCTGRVSFAPEVDFANPGAALRQCSLKSPGACAVYVRIAKTIRR
jgi:hypothetical protein